MKIFSFPITLLMATIALLLSYPKASAATVDVTVAPNGQLVFSPSSITINPGDTVRWTWAATFHSSTSGIPGMPNGIWDSGILNQGATFSHTFNSTGSFPYYCTPHGGCCGMVGMITHAHAHIDALVHAYANSNTRGGGRMLSELHDSGRVRCA